MAIIKVDSSFADIDWSDVRHTRGLQKRLESLKVLD
jgi:hypothetical protein